MIYENGTLKRILVEGGYIAGTAYNFYLQDHLGNNRVVASASGAVVQSNHYYPFGATFYDSSGAAAQPYQYNGKEMDTKGGLNWLDYGARHYDPVIGRWGVLDPKAEEYYSVSPYVYALNNPVNLIDPDGKAAQYPPGGGTQVRMGFTNWSPQKTERVYTAAQAAGTAGKQVFAGSGVGLSGSIVPLGGKLSIGSVGVKIEGGIGNLSTSTDGSNLTTAASIGEIEYSVNLGTASLTAEGTIGEVQTVVGRNEGKVETTGISTNLGVQVGDAARVGANTDGTISAGIKAGPVKADLSVNFKAAGEWLKGTMNTIKEMFTPEIEIIKRDEMNY
jgi:RHS repeat-associated protein